MPNKSPLLTVLIFSLLVTFLFYKESPGLNILIAELSFFLWLLFTKQLKFKNGLSVISSVGFISTGLFIVISYSPLTILSNFLALGIFIGVLIKNCLQRLGLAAGWVFVAVSAPMTMHIKERKFYESEKQIIKRSTR